MAIQEKALVPEKASPILLPVDLHAEIQRAKAQMQALETLMKELLVPGVDFDRVPGTDKPSLHQPGAQQLCIVFHLVPKSEIIVREVDWDRQPVPLIHYVVKVSLFHRESGLLVAEGLGSCNSFENRYRWRWEGEGEERQRVDNPDIPTLENTIVKMAEKRAYVNATLKATGASRLFTQDLEDMLPEPASEKQLNLIRHLASQAGLAVQELIQRCSAVAGRSIEKLEDLTRQEASAVIDALKKGSSESQQASKGQPKSEEVKRPAPADSNGDDDKRKGAVCQTIYQLAHKLSIDDEMVRMQATDMFYPERDESIQSLKELSYDQLQQLRQHYYDACKRQGLVK